MIYHLSIKAIMLLISCSRVLGVEEVRIHPLGADIALLKLNVEVRCPGPGVEVWPCVIV